ncbi:MDR family NADP-dependent oxidoreductase [Parahaliea aestuarii]|uniref:NADP-dependent oxidoreductase n=1 Tax=Parahaliea aestuarii TaxID=1852021 RepID=A0A5C9A4T1_9GAMM|nr:NADP-dependent oxidoreductase [Parahaliea aestuarii]TXS95079.1 NADP-dependent oxidoreductase [Parahaliea aestuarii]
MTSNQAVVLARFPRGEITPEDFAIRDIPVPEPDPGQFVTRNLVLSMDAGFRQWMNEGAGDNYLPGMALETPVQSIVLGRVVASEHADYPVGTVVNARTAWEEYSLLDGSDLCSPLTLDPRVPVEEYMATLGPTGMTAYFGLLEVGRPVAGEVLVVSAAGGAVGTVVGQLGRLQGCYCIGLTSSETKARWLEEEVGYHRALSRERYPDLPAALREAAPDGLDIFFDNVGGSVLDASLGHLRERARLVLCGAIAQYERDQPEPVYNAWELITKRATASGFMFSDYADRFGEAMGALMGWLQAGEVRGFLNTYEGLGSVPEAFCDMMHGRSRGKCLVRLGD